MSPSRSAPSRHHPAEPRVGWVALACFVVLLASAALFLAVYFQESTEVGVLTRDPATTTGMPWYLGLTSSLGVVGWAVAAGTFGLAALVTVRRHDPAWRSLLGGMGLSVLLLLDDVYLLHDQLLLRWIDSELTLYAAYALLAASWAITAFRSLSMPSRLAMLLSATMLVVSVGIDVFWLSEADVRLVFEDGTKVAGIWLWVVFAAVAGLTAVEQTGEVSTSQATVGGRLTS